MRWRNYSTLLLLWLICITNQFIFFRVCGESELIETKAFITFLGAIDPTNMLSQGSSLGHCSDQWTGVKCDLQTHSITEIMFQSMNLSGVLDTDSLCKLPSLQVLNLANNHIGGPIPDSISSCISLTYLNLSNNMFQGVVPVSLREMKNLKSLDITGNNFQVVNLMNQLNLTQLYVNYSNQEERVTTLGQFMVYNATGDMLSPHVDTEEGDKGMGVPNKTPAERWFLVLVCIAFLSLLVFVMNKRSYSFKSIMKKAIQQSLEDSSIKISVAKTGGETKQGEESSELTFFVEEHERFQIEDLLESAADLQGQSLCSSLYKVRLKNNAIYAVKRLKKLEVPFAEFQHTMRLIGSLKHPNISSLVASYSSKEEKLLIYRYQKNGSLLALLENYAEGKRDFPWRLRLSIANGIAQALHFIHQKPYTESIPHGNLKLSNILLTENEEPLISEFGFQRFLDPKKACLYSSNGYKAPEKQLTKQADVFSFGVILLELLTGKTVERSGLDLPKWVKSMVREEWTGEVFDKEVNKVGKQWAFPLLNVALKCVSHKPEQRPQISEVLNKIEEAANDQDEFSFSSTSSVESTQHDGFLLHTVPEVYETPGSNH